MLSLQSYFIRNAFRQVSKEFVRCSRRNAGVELRRELIKLNPEEVEDLDLDMEDLESDFSKAHISYKEHLLEQKARKEQEKLHIVKQKYFKQKLPNFLTWHDKEQIRHLHQTNPEEWTIEALSEGFPAMPETIQKIVKSHWTKDKPHKITNHDNSVKRNWQMFKSGRLEDLPRDLIEHLKKFTNRALQFKTFDEPEDKIKQLVHLRNPKLKTEFSDIITSYYKMSKSDNQEAEQVAKVLPTKRMALSKGDSDSNLPPHYAPSKSMITLSQLKKGVKQKVDKEDPMDEDDSLIFRNITNQTETRKISHSSITDNDSKTTGIVKRHNEGSVENFTKKTDRDLSHLNYPEWIRVNKSNVKKSCLFKLNDCYYDYDGEFLYRVPGMG